LPKQNLAVILCPQLAVGANVRDCLGNKVNQGITGNRECPVGGTKAQHYLCAIVSPGALADAYEVNLWRQIVVDVEEMEAEVLLQYDVATRYYHTTV
jgi:kinesin family protein 2/24